MSRFEDLTNETFGKLRVIERGEDYISKNGKHYIQWLVKCDCNRFPPFLVRVSTLKSGLSTACRKCGYEKSGRKKIEDLTGKTFGKIVVIERGEDYISPKGSHSTTWNVECSCGKRFQVRAGDLKNGKTTRCKNCAIKILSQNKIKDLSGTIFGKLKVVRFDCIREKTGAFWIVRCSCGNEEFSCMASNLQSGHVKSCGCLRESHVAFELKKYFIKKYNAKKEKKLFKNTETKKWLRCDIYIPHGKNPDINGFYIEVHGEQHYRLHNWHKQQSKRNKTTPEEEFKNQKNRDKLKKNFAKKNGTYIEIDLRKIKEAEVAIEYVEKIMRKTLSQLR